MSFFKNKFRAIYNSYHPSFLQSYIHCYPLEADKRRGTIRQMLQKRDNFGIVANICVVQVLRTFYLNCVTPVASRAGGGHGGKHRNLPIFASDRFSSWSCLLSNKTCKGTYIHAHYICTLQPPSYIPGIPTLSHQYENICSCDIFFFNLSFFYVCLGATKFKCSEFTF